MLPLKSECYSSLVEHHPAVSMHPRWRLGYAVVSPDSLKTLFNLPTLCHQFVTYSIPGSILKQGA
ncbi:MAG: hypothetical protein KDI63_06055 [Gammaproteobacteria bacterium]|nr:hypothetical protein [Gammaproteobacteria bacterium]